jgi:hypothetical protein
MARGAESKLEITRKILETFDGSFLFNEGKEIRIPCKEEGEDVQIKITLTAAKINVAPGDDVALPEAPKKPDINSTSMKNSAFSAETAPVAPTEEEKANVRNLLESLGL